VELSNDMKAAVKVAAKSMIRITEVAHAEHPRDPDKAHLLVQSAGIQVQLEMMRMIDEDEPA